MPEASVVELGNARGLDDIHPLPLEYRDDATALRDEAGSHTARRKSRNELEQAAGSAPESAYRMDVKDRDRHGTLNRPGRHARSREAVLAELSYRRSIVGLHGIRQGPLRAGLDQDLRQQHELFR